MLKLAMILVLNFFLSIPLYADVVEQKTINFKIAPEDLMKGNVHYFLAVASPKSIAKKFPELLDLDSLSLLRERDSKILVLKSVTVVNKSIGFFDDRQMTDEVFVKHIMGDQRIQKLSSDSYQIQVPGENSHSYKMQAYFDSDDISTLPSSKTIRAATATKKLDIISQGASSIMVSELTNYSRFSQGGVVTKSFIPLKENKTLIIQYQLQAFDKKIGKLKVLKPGLISELVEVKKLIESYK